MFRNLGFPSPNYIKCSSNCRFQKLCIKTKNFSVENLISINSRWWLSLKFTLRKSYSTDIGKLCLSWCQAFPDTSHKQVHITTYFCEWVFWETFNSLTFVQNAQPQIPFLVVSDSAALYFQKKNALFSFYDLEITLSFRIVTVISLPLLPIDVMKYSNPIRKSQLLLSCFSFTPVLNFIWFCR